MEHVVIFLGGLLAGALVGSALREWSIAKYVRRQGKIARGRMASSPDQFTKGYWGAVNKTLEEAWYVLTSSHKGYSD